MRKYPISNRYLFAEWNKDIFGETRGVILETSRSEGSLIKLSNQPVFRFELENMNREVGYGAFASGIISVLCFLVGIYWLTKHLHESRKFELAFVVLLSAFVLLRIIMVTYNFPNALIVSSVFDPQYFASSNYNSSVGDLFFNSIGVLILCGYVFFTYYHWRLVSSTLQASGWTRFAIATMALTLAFFSFLYPFLFVETIFHNSSISLDITETIQFDWLRSLSWLSILVGAISAFFFVHALTRLSRALLPRALQFMCALVLAGLFFAVYFLSASRDYLITLSIAAVFFLILFLTNLASSLRKADSVTFIYFFVVIAAFGLQHGLSIQHFVEEKRAESQLKFASNYLIGRDVLGEYLLNESTKRIRQDAFIQNRLNNPFLTKSAIRQKIKQIYLNSYFDRYEAQIYLYNSNGEPLDNTSPESLSVFTNRFRDSSSATDYEGIYFIQPSDIDSNKRYISMIPIYRAEQIVGFVLLDLSLKRIIPKNVYPELLVDRRFAEFFENAERSFCFIKDGKILSSFGTFNYDRDFDFSNLSQADFYKTGISQSGYFHTGVEDVSGQVAVITSAAYPIFYVLTNFSFFFVLGVFLLVIIMLIYGFVSMIKGYKMNYAARIQLYIYLAFSLPLCVATITTLNRVSKSAENELNHNFETNARNLGEGILSYVSEYFKGNLPKSDFENILIDRAKVTNTDITFYDRSGRYVASSQPLIVENQITSALMNRSVWEKINLEGVSSMVAEERIGSLRFNNCYVTLKSPDSGTVLGVLSVPFFDSANSLEGTRVNVLANFLTVFTIIFILFSILSFYVVNSLTFPLKFITRILARTTLSGDNKLLEWKSNDEIGMMVSEYNKMVNNLEQSKVELARSQKESAWREIAKQVAHEIKNPLTPMKLTLQHMEYQLKVNNLDEAKARTSINALLTQVDILNDIASSFSAFARMPAPILERIDLISLLKRSVDLYGDYEGGEVAFRSAITSASVMGDEQLFHRIFSNIILNALQAGHGEKITVTVSIDLSDHDYLISIQDNGKGIEPEMINKVFTPYFSTKQSGSGLGLAISKQGIEQSGGEIWFDTKPNQGTTFYIKLPRVD
jgi:signal transduction histidine kinase